MLDLPLIVALVSISYANRLSCSHRNGTMPARCGSLARAKLDEMSGSAVSLDSLPPAFFADQPFAVTRRLLGQRLVRRLDGEVLVGRIVEAEAYGGIEDSTSHAYRGQHGRAKRMFGPVGRAYVYLIYGMHRCLNVVAHAEDGAGAVLIRALAPEGGMARMSALRRGAPLHLLASGPGRLCDALLIDRSLDGIDLCDPRSSLFLAAGPAVPDGVVAASPRVGVRGRPADMQVPWRLYVTDDPNVSRGHPGRNTTAAAHSGVFPEPGPDRRDRDES